eukprot:scaffold107325_cov50-Cyclotella_meneghiniana.AAC.1
MSSQKNISATEFVESPSKSKSHRAIAELRERQTIVANHRARAAGEDPEQHHSPSARSKQKRSKPTYVELNDHRVLRKTRLKFIVHIRPTTITRSKLKHIRAATSPHYQIKK